MRTINAIFKREFFGYFRSPVAYVFLIVFLIASIGLTWFVGQFFAANDASLNRFFLFMPWVFLFLIPAVGMRLWAEEKRSGTWELLLTLPVTTVQAVLGKFLAGWAFITLAILLTLTMPITVAYLGNPDWGPIFSGYIGTILMAGAFLSICSLTSALTKNQVISFVLSVIICLILVFLGWSVFNNLLTSIHVPVWIIDALSNFSFITHFDPMTKGLITIADLIFYLSLMGFSLLLNVFVLERSH
jgi:ABC-2 type transport system permease protein